MSASFQLQRQATRNPDDGLAQLSEFLELDYLESDTGTDLELSIPATATNPIVLLNVIHIVTEAFDGGATIDIGDGTDIDEYIATGDITAASLGNIVQSRAAAEDDAMGEYLTAARKIVVTIGGAPTVGEGTVLAEVLRL